MHIFLIYVRFESQFAGRLETMTLEKWRAESVSVEKQLTTVCWTERKGRTIK